MNKHNTRAKLRTFEGVLKALNNFRDKRDWKKYHTPLQLALSLVLESSEVLEVFQWKNEKEIKNWLRESGNKSKLSEELADVLSYLVLLADATRIDLPEALKDKLKKNDVNYPISKSRGNAKKYTEL